MALSKRSTRCSIALPHVAPITNRSLSIIAWQDHVFPAADRGRQNRDPPVFNDRGSEVIVSPDAGAHVAGLHADTVHAVSLDAWSIDINGLIEQPISLTRDQFSTQPPRESGCESSSRHHLIATRKQPAFETTATCDLRNASAPVDDNRHLPQSRRLAGDGIACFGLPRIGI